MLSYVGHICCRNYWSTVLYGCYTAHLFMGTVTEKDIRHGEVNQNYDGINEDVQERSESKSGH